ncbi:MAG: ComEC/Rec2 family competence protein [Eisenbergiella sp.]
MPTGPFSLAFSSRRAPLLRQALPVRGIFLIYEKLCLLTQHLPGRWHAGMPHMWQILLFYAGLAVLLVLAEKIPKKAGWPLATMLCLIFAVNPRGETQLTMLDMGQGDCIYIRTESGNHYLYDAGSTSRKDTGTWQVIPFLKYQGVDRLEAVFVSHWDEDHVNGLDAVFEWADQSGIPIGGLCCRVKALTVMHRISSLKAPGTMESLYTA